MGNTSTAGQAQQLVFGLVLLHVFFFACFCTNRSHLHLARLTQTTVSDLVRAPDASTSHAVELAALREELAETRELVNRIARTLDGLARPRSVPGSVSTSRDS